MSPRDAGMATAHRQFVSECDNRAIGFFIVGCTPVQTEAERGRYVAENGARTASRGARCAERVAPGHVLPPPVEAPSFMMIAAKPDTTRLSQAIKLTVAGLLSRFIVVDRQARKAPGRA